jgi:hypothetical protein
VPNFYICDRCDAERPDGDRYANAKWVTPNELMQLVEPGAGTAASRVISERFMASHIKCTGGEWGILDDSILWRCACGEILEATGQEVLAEMAKLP